MWRIIFLIVCCFDFSLTSAQRLKYKELFPALDTISTSEEMSLLWEFMTEDPNHANANYRLAMLHYRMFKNADPLLEYTKAMANARESSLRLGRAKLLVTTQEVRSNNEYYSSEFKTFDAKGKPYVEFPIVQQKINNAIDSAQRFQQLMPSIYKNFTKSVGFYDQAVKMFAALNTRYKSLEDVYMFYDGDMDAELGQLKLSYDSSVHYFRQYKVLTEDYSLEKYNQKFREKNISVYRMDGLITRLNFLTPEIDLWNYSHWVDNVRKMCREEIASVKGKIETNETKLNEILTQLESPTTFNGTIHTLSKDLVFQLNNYDKNSLALSLLEYKVFKQNWLLKLQSVGKDTTIDSKLELYSHLIQLNRVADSLTTHVKSVIDPLNLKKHQPFLQKYYDGEKGLEKFMMNETEWIKKSFSQYQDILKGNLLASGQVNETPNKFVRIGNFNVPLFVDKKSIPQLDNTALLTLKIVHNPDGTMYLSGVHKMSKKTNNNLIGFVARVNADGKPAWLKELNFSPDSLPQLDANNYVGDMVPTQEGCAIVVTSIRAANQKSSNTFVFVNDKGELKTFRLKDTGIARKLLYQEASNSFIMAFKGNDLKQQYQTEENISVSSINILGDLLWRQEIAMAGTLQDIIVVRDGYVVAGNFTAMKDQTGKEVRTKINLSQSNPYLIKMNLRGEVTDVMPIVSSKSVYIDKVVKVNDGSINLLGSESTFSVIDDMNAARGNVMHMMTTYNLKTVFANFQNESSR